MKLGKTVSTKITRTLTYIFLILGSAVFMLPFVWLLRSSFMELGQIFIIPPEWIPKPFRWQNYVEALTAAPFLKYFINTLKILIFNESGVVATSIICAYSFARLRWPGRDFIFAILLTSLMLPYAVTLIPTFILWKILGGLNTFYPLTVPAWFGGGMFNIFLLRQFFLTIPYELDEAAYMDGANPLKVLWSIVVPLSKPAVITVAIFNFIGVWNDLLGPIIYLSDPDKYTLAIGLSVFRSMYVAQWHYLMAASVVILLPVIVVFFIGQRYFIQGITLTGLKG
ncbi:MAG: carbohydrate ABC transporter permease [bacterium]